MLGTTNCVYACWLVVQSHAPQAGLLLNLVHGEAGPLIETLASLV